MTYENHCRKMFQGAKLEVEDFYLLEPYQIVYLEERAPHRKLAAVLKAHPHLERFFLKKCPQMEAFFGSLSNRYDPASSDEELALFSDSLLWEVADMLVYCKEPTLYDDRLTSGWTFDDAAKHLSVEDKVVIDGGAGTGRISFAIAERAQHVFAVEPNTSMRRFISQKAKEISVANVYPIDGFLDSIPLPDNFADVLITLNAIGWCLEKELPEFERVIKPGGQVAHLTGRLEDVDNDPIVGVMTSSDWQYICESYNDGDGPKRMYIKKVCS